MDRQRQLPAGRSTKLRSRVASVMAAVLFVAALRGSAADVYVRASVNEVGQLVIVSKDERATVLQREPEQVGFDQIAISENGQTVGWLALYPNCCTSYPIPLKLMVYSDGRVRAFTGSGLPIWQWRFIAGGSRVVFRQETVHGGLNVHYELRDIVTGRLVSEWNPTVGRDNQPLANQMVPPWAAELDSK